jgi:hypothetical protein
MILRKQIAKPIRSCSDFQIRCEIVECYTINSVEDKSQYAHFRSIENTSPSQIFQLSLGCPPYELAALKMCPVCVELKPGESKRVEIDFVPKGPQYLEQFSMLNGVDRTGTLEGKMGANGKAKDHILDDGLGGNSGGADAPGSPGAESSADSSALALKNKQMKEECASHGGRRWLHVRENTDYDVMALKQGSNPMVPQHSFHAEWKIPVLIKPVTYKMSGEGKPANSIKYRSNCFCY